MTIPFIDFAQFDPLYVPCIFAPSCRLCALYEHQRSRLALHVMTRYWYGV